MSFDRDAVESFLFLEARLLDGMAYEAWLELFDEKALYWIPSNRDHIDPAREVSIVYADREQLGFRIDQLLSGSAWVQDPQPRLCRAVSNIEIREAGDEDLEVESVIQLMVLRRQKSRNLMGRVHHRLRRHAGGFRIVQKKVVLVDNDEVIDDLTFLV
ncbi:MAG: ring-hydroxylating dioxygenase subunit beta [Deltaproteobacteria bacterium]|nr:MAG: ring-hydroxylating dioxygenase subunit beta [Deltaproteobacteria bacterium]